ncbi:fasciclin domain-containing protein [Pedobacter sp. MW01-1-1]|uniref:fasciclin domain-containing protein n=1 Tax=Pedobacter sp. MW01-1-1 TaxID=3383027 RepID=UPI003FF00B4C
MIKKHILYIALLGISTFLFSCKDTWQDHIEVTNVDNDTNLAQKIAAQSNLSVFNGYLQSTGYAKMLENSQNYTVWAPSNAALANLDQAIVNDPAKLKDFVGNHIASTTIAISTKPNDTLRVQLLNNKYATIIGSKFEEGTITSGSGQFVKNGVLHVLDQAVPTKLNVWDFMLTSTDAPLQTNYIKNLSIEVIDSANATIIGYNASGAPIFAPNPPKVTRNTYWVNVADLRNESNQYTFFMLQDPAFTAESNKLTSYYPSVDPNFNASFYMTKDLTVKGVYTVNQLPDTLISVKGVKIPMNKATVVKSYRASNGIVHVVNALPFRLKDKVPVFKFEGELPLGFTASRTVLYRNKLDNLGIPFKDIEIYNHATSELGIYYFKSYTPVVKYKVYARAISGLPGDSQVANFTQRYFFLNSTTALYNLTFTQTVVPLTYTETYLGEYTQTMFGPLMVRLTSAASTSKDVNTLILDYLRFEPVLP